MSAYLPAAYVQREILEGLNKGHVRTSIDIADYLAMQNRTSRRHAHELKRGGYVDGSTAVFGEGDQRVPRVVYTITSKGLEALEDWDPRADPKSWGKL